MRAWHAARIEETRRHLARRGGLLSTGPGAPSVRARRAGAQGSGRAFNTRGEALPELPPGVSPPPRAAQPTAEQAPTPRAASPNARATTNAQGAKRPPRKARRPARPPRTFAPTRTPRARSARRAKRGAQTHEGEPSDPKAPRSPSSRTRRTTTTRPPWCLTSGFRVRSRQGSKGVLLVRRRSRTQSWRERRRQIFPWRRKAMTRP